MATLIPSLGSARFDARGELRLAERLKDCLEDNAWVWHNIPVGPFGKHPDFVTLHPQQGIVVLEVKDWRLETIINANSKQVELITDRGSVSTDNPFQQVREYMFSVVNTLQREPLLVNGGGNFKGKPVFSYGHGVVFTNITRKQFEQTDLCDVFPPERCIFRDEMTESIDPDIFRERVWKMVTPRIGPALSLPQIDRVRALLFPEIRVTQIALPFGEPPAKGSSADDRMLAVMDMQQELLARSLEPISAGFIPRVDAGRGWMQDAACRRWSFHRQGLQRRRRRAQRQPGGPLACGRIAVLRSVGGERLHCTVRA